MDIYLFEPLTRALEPIDRIINCVILLVNQIFKAYTDGSIASSSWMYMVVNTICSNSYLLIGVSLLLCGFVISILKRMISM